MSVKTPIPSRSEVDLPDLDQAASLEDVVKAFNKLTSNFNRFNKLLSLQSNFDGFIATNVTIPAVSSVKIQHFLGVKPKWRIILRQTGNGVITDVDSGWDTKVISLYNEGAESVTITVFIARE